MKSFLGIILAAAMTLSLCAATVSAAEAKTSAQTTAASNSKTEEKPATYAADKASVIGKWYMIGGDGCGGEIIFTFNKNGTFKMSYEQEIMSGTFSLKKAGLLVLTVKDNGGTETVYVPAVMDNGTLLLSQDEIEYKDFKAYKSGQKLDEYFDDVPLFFSKKKPVPANQEDILGAWVASEWDNYGIYELGIMVFNKKSTSAVENYETVTEPVVFKNGLPVTVGNISEKYTYEEPDDLMYLCGDRLYRLDGGYDMVIFERYKKKTLTDKVLERAYDEDEIFYFKGGKICFYYNCFYYNIDKPVKYKIDGDYLSFTYDGQKYRLKAYITDNYLYLSSKDETLVMLRKKTAKGQ